MSDAQETPAAPPQDEGASETGWLQSRTGYRRLLHTLLDEKVSGGARWAYVFGSLLLIALCNQVLTGLLLMAFYAPSATDAWASVAYIQDQVRLGWLIRGLHSSSASLLCIGVVLHMVQVAVYGAYRAPREVNWWTGLLLALLLMGFALTGYLLPWDQKGYWATQVATTLLGATPLIGPALQQLVQGGRSYGNLTLTHFYALHVFVLPLGLLALVGIHLALFRRHGVTPHPRRQPDELARSSEPFWPRQAVYDMTAGALMLAGLFIWVVRSHGAELSAPADPAAPYDARPEWYFLPLFQLLKYFPGSLEIVAAMGAPAVFLGALALLPWLDRSGPEGASRAISARLRSLTVLALCLGSLAALGILAQREDQKNAAFQKHKADAEAQARRARQLAWQGVPVAGGVAVYENDPLEAGRKLFLEHCAGCHRLDRMGPADEDQKGPHLSRFASRAWLAGFLQAPDSPTYYGRSKVRGGMKPVELPPNQPGDQLGDLVEYLYSLAGPPGAGGQPLDAGKVARGAVLFEEKNCDLCHERDGKTSGQGPNLLGYASETWLREFLLHPGAATYYGEKNDMPAFGKKLGETELARLVTFLRAQRER
ncbi:cytochrome b N-terminal domain-containing protein [Haliangium sp. UPWRP_2]|uniref:cytochrome b N-terminal domain-containing protein n=1 Tax=Haliangium sp. UPWRP_2 TaxID=1931276 RepID=UPI000B542A08|nr:cytochrome b N-terminal domain-containing protein [Haliangium sp. UPWRP_2]PSM32278.1 cytochrome b6 [Haliangium sp. UPWRP_2]